MTLGEYERQLEQDKTGALYGAAVAQAVSGIAQGIGGLGIGGGVLLAGLLWGKDLKELKDNIVEMFPDGSPLFSPSWIASWGEDPQEILGDSLGATDNDVVNGLEPVVSSSGTHSLEGLDPYSVYSLTCAGRLAHYTWEKANIVSEYRLQHPLSAFGPHDSDADIISKWHRANPRPPDMLTFEECNDQTGLRLTCARIDATPGFAWIFQERNPSKKSNYVGDPLLDWLAYTDVGQGHEFLWIEGALAVNIMDKASPRPYDYSQRRFKGERQIALYAYWAAPISAP